MLMMIFKFYYEEVIYFFQFHLVIHFHDFMKYFHHHHLKIIKIIHIFITVLLFLS